MSDCFMLRMGYREWMTRGHISPQIMARWGGVGLIYVHVEFFLPYVLIKRPILTTLPIFTCVFPTPGEPKISVSSPKYKPPPRIPSKLIKNFVKYP